MTIIGTYELRSLRLTFVKQNGLILSNVAERSILSLLTKYQFIYIPKVSDPMIKY